MHNKEFSKKNSSDRNILLYGPFNVFNENKIIAQLLKTVILRLRNFVGLKILSRRFRTKKREPVTWI